MDAIRTSDSFPVGLFRERVKELRCLQDVVTVIESRGVAPEAIFTRLLNVIPAGWQHPSLCRVRITVRGRAFEAPGFAETPWMQRVPLKAGGAVVGGIEICYI